MKTLKKDPNRSHVIYFNDQSVTCYEHTNESVIELVKRYYEGKYNFSCSVEDKEEKEIYKTV